MSLLIDGYNLINAVGLVGKGLGPGGLERSRLALLNFIAESLDGEEASRATIVFDASGAPPDLPASMIFRGLTVRFARGYDDADTLIEELIRADSAPRKLTVVSSDHRLHKAARRRKARAVDSDVWYAERLSARQQRVQPPHAAAERPAGAPSSAEVEYWLRQFTDKPPTAEPSAEDIFPPGYGEDVEDGLA